MLTEMLQQLKGPRKIHLDKMTRNNDTVTMSVPTPDTHYPRELISFVTGEFGKRSSTRGDDVRAAAGETIVNAIIHGNDNDPSKQISVFCLWRNKIFYVAIKDDGLGFDLDKPPFIKGKSGIPPEGGIGLSVTRQRTDLLYNFGDSVTYFAVDSKRILK